MAAQVIPGNVVTRSPAGLGSVVIFIGTDLSTMSTDVAREVQGLEGTESAVAPAIATEDGRRPRLAAFEDKVAMEFK